MSHEPSITIPLARYHELLDIELGLTAIGRPDLRDVLRMEPREERTGLPVPSAIERDQAYQLLPNTPLMKDGAHAYGALMFALGRRQVSREIEGLIAELVTVT